MHVDSLIWFDGSCIQQLGGYDDSQLEDGQKKGLPGSIDTHFQVDSLDLEFQVGLEKID